MGIVTNQGIREAGLQIIGIGIGIISMIYIYPLNHEDYGYAQFILSSALLLNPILGLGISQSIIKFFTFFQESSKKSETFFFLGLVSHSISFGIVAILLFFFGDSFFSSLSVLGVSLEKIQINLWFILFLGFFVLNCVLLMNYISNYNKVAIPSGIYALGYKIALPIIILLGLSNFLSGTSIAIAMMFFYGLAFIALLLYAYYIKALKFGIDGSFITIPNIKKIYKFSLYSALTGLGGILAFRLDGIMITEMLGATSTGLYFNIYIIAMMIGLPSRSINKIAAPIISKLWENNDTNEISNLYEKSALNSLIIGTLIFLGIWLNLDQLFSLTSNPEAFEGASRLFIILGSAVLLDSATSVNTQIIVYSSFYKYNLYFIVVLGILNVIMNYILIGSLGIMGAALSTLISISLFNIIKLIFIKVKFGFFPFDIRSVYIFIIAIITFLFLIVIPVPNNPLVAIVIKSILISVIFGGSVYYFGFSQDINNLINKYVSFKKIQ